MKSLNTLRLKKTYKDLETLQVWPCCALIFLVRCYGPLQPSESNLVPFFTEHPVFILCCWAVGLRSAAKKITPLKIAARAVRGSSLLADTICYTTQHWL